MRSLSRLGIKEVVPMMSLWRLLPVAILAMVLGACQAQEPRTTDEDSDVTVESEYPADESPDVEEVEQESDGAEEPEEVDSNADTASDARD